MPARPTKPAAQPAADAAAPAASRGAKRAEPGDLGAAVLHAWSTNDAITRYLLEHLDDVVWEAAPPGGTGRTVAAIAAHVHNVRVMWLKAADKAHAPPEGLDRRTVTRGQALAALRESHDALRRVLAESLAAGGRVKGFKPDAVGFLGYLIAHEAHHRGQIGMLARQLGHPLPQAVMFGMWEWGTRGRGLEDTGARPDRPPPPRPAGSTITGDLMRAKLTDDELAQALAALPGWSRGGDALTRTFTFPAYMDGIAFVNRVAHAAEAADHHPDLHVGYRRVTCTLATHDAGGITRADVRLAGEIDRLAAGAA